MKQIYVSNSKKKEKKILIFDKNALFFKLSSKKLFLICLNTHFPKIK